MALKLSGKDFKAFYGDTSIWTPGTYHDDVLLRVNGEVFMSDSMTTAVVTDIPDGAVVELVSGYLLHGGNINAKADLQSVLRAWLREQKAITVPVSIPAEKLAAVRDAIIAAGGEVLF